jgi:nucleotide-binding universal stress UspA family protein
MAELLVAVDGSPHSEKIVDYACGLAKSLSATIILLYAVPEIDIPEEYLNYARDEKIADPVVTYMRTIAEQVLLKLGHRITERGLEYEGVHEIGNPADRIVRTAESRKVALGVMGLHGLHGLGLVRSLGSVARRVIENSSVPVVVP